MAGEPEGTGESPYYISYLLRLWRETDAGKAPLWRASLENPQSGERKGFASLIELFHYLWQETANQRGDSSPSDRTGEGGDASENK
jgi:hypothetical protein